MKKSDACLVSAIAGVLTLSAAVPTAAEGTGPQTEMCFGYRLENSCGTNGSGLWRPRAQPPRPGYRAAARRNRQ